MKVQEVINQIIRKTEVSLCHTVTCDKLVEGDGENEVTGIVTTFMATVDVIKKAAALGANLIITHEPTWFSGADESDWLREDPVYLQKKSLIQETNMNIWRFHDHMHCGVADEIYRGFDRETGWAPYIVQSCKEDERFGQLYQIPRTSLRKLAEWFKKILHMDVIQIVGNPDMIVERVAVLVGGGSLGLGREERPMELMHRNHLDLLICGDITEWTISAYVRDATMMNMNKGMLVLGHERSEEAGMKHLPEWLKELVPDISISFVDAGEPFQYL